MPKLTLLFLALFYAEWGLAQSTVWHIEPDSCVVTENIRLELRSDTGTQLAQATIAYTVLKAQSQRRRIRLPWSVF